MSSNTVPTHHSSSGAGRDPQSRDSPGPSGTRSESSFWLTNDMRYTKYEAIGWGAFATVFRARENSTAQLLAVKRFDISYGPNTLKEVKYEARILRLAGDGPHIVHIGHTRVNVIDLVPEIPMQFFPHNLADLMAETRRERGLLVNEMVLPPWYNVVLIQMLEALQFLHSKKVMVVHRDITPENILYDQPDHFILAGFSLARIVFPDKGEYLERRCFRYLAPEVYAGLEETTGVDIWALGVLCLDMLCLLPNMTVSEGQPSFESFRYHNWCNILIGFANHAGRPEVEMMTVKSAAERFTAGEVLRFVSSSPSSKIQRYPASVDLLCRMASIHTGLENYSEDEIRQFMEEYMRANPYSPSSDQSPTPPQDRASSSRSAAGHLPSGASQTRTESTPQPEAAGAGEGVAQSTLPPDTRHEPSSSRQREQPVQEGSKPLAKTSFHLTEVPEQALRGPRTQGQRSDVEPNPPARQPAAQFQKNEAEAMKRSGPSSDTADARRQPLKADPGHQPSQPSAPILKGAESSPSRSRPTPAREERGKGRAGQASPPPQDPGSRATPPSSSSSPSSRSDKAQLEQGGVEAHQPPPPLPTSSRRQRQDPSSSSSSSGHREEIGREQGKAATIRTKKALSPPLLSEPTGQSSQKETTQSKTKPSRTAPQAERDQPSQQQQQHHAEVTSTRQEASFPSPSSGRQAKSSRSQHAQPSASRGQRPRRQ